MPLQLGSLVHPHHNLAPALLILPSLRPFPTRGPQAPEADLAHRSTTI